MASSVGLRARQGLCRVRQPSCSAPIAQPRPGRHLLTSPVWHPGNPLFANATASVAFPAGGDSDAGGECGAMLDTRRPCSMRMIAPPYACAASSDGSKSLQGAQQAAVVAPELKPGGFLAKLRALAFFLWSFLLALPLFVSMLLMAPLVMLTDKYRCRELPLNSKHCFAGSCILGPAPGFAPLLHLSRLP